MQHGSIYEKNLLFCTKKLVIFVVSVHFQKRFYFFFSNFLKANFSNNLWQNICRLFLISVQFSFTTSRKGRLEFPNDLGFRILRNFKKIPELPGIYGKYAAGHQNGKLNNCGKSEVKDSIEKPILFNFDNFSTIFCPRLYFIGKIAPVTHFL